MKTPRVFISMGTPYTPEYSAFRDALESMLNDRCGVSPRIIGKNEYPDGSPLHKIRDVMATCDGVIIVAYERKFVEQGVERRGGAEPINLVSRKYTTPWNHVESAIAFATKLPIYIICQKGLTEEGLIESKIDWYVQHLDFTPADLTAPHVVDSIRSWVDQRVIPHSRKSKALLSAVAKLKFSEMTGEEWAAILAIIGVAFSAGAVVAKFFPQFLH